MHADVMASQVVMYDELATTRLNLPVSIVLCEKSQTSLQDSAIICASSPCSMSRLSRQFKLEVFTIH